MEFEELVPRVEELYAAQELPAWQDPRPDGREPTEAEYSRVTDPGRYRIVHARARAWAEVLRERVGATVEPVEVAAVPDCGCDACDQGSADLLEAIDDVVRRVVSGPFVALRGDGWHAEWSPDAQSSGYRPGAAVTDHVVADDLCRRLAAGEEVELPPGTTTYVGVSWLD